MTGQQPEPADESLAEELAGLPESPVNLRQVCALCRQTLHPVDLEYVGVVDGLHTWRNVHPIPSRLWSYLRVDVIPPRTQIILRPPSGDA